MATLRSLHGTSEGFGIAENTGDVLAAGGAASAGTAVSLADLDSGPAAEDQSRRTDAGAAHLDRIPWRPVPFRGRP
ncbi:hypothetical protein ACWEWX_52780, partial [Streptomyces asiaticus]